MTRPMTDRIIIADASKVSGCETCNGCDREYVNGFCAACNEFAADQPEPKTLDQLLAESSGLREYRDFLRAKLGSFPSELLPENRDRWVA